MPELTTITNTPANFESTICRLFLAREHAVVDVCSSARWITSSLAANKDRRALVACHESRLHDLEEQLSDFANVTFHSYSNEKELRIDDFAQQTSLRHLPFVRIESEDELSSVLCGASYLLRHSRIDCLLFNLTQPDDLKLRAVSQHLINNKYHLCAMDSEKITRMSIEQIAAGHSSGPLFALQERLIPWYFKDDPTVLDYFNLRALCGKHDLAVKGVIHVGAHEGQELPEYHKLRTKRVFFIEANPEVFARLKENVGHVPGVRILNRAILDRGGEIALNVASFDQSSSIFELAKHLDFYPGISESHKLLVKCSTLDDAMREESLDASAYNLLVLDVQGAELATLKGATKTLQSIAGILAEVCFDNLFNNAPQVEEIDEFLNDFGFHRVATESFCHPSWGNAFYARVN